MKKKNLPTVEAQTWVQTLCECPCCGERIDLLSIIEENGDDPINPCESQDVEIKVDCPGCEISFVVTRINY